MSETQKVLPLSFSETCEKQPNQWFSDINLPQYSNITLYSQFYRYKSSMTIQNHSSLESPEPQEPHEPQEHLRGAPVKRKNNLVRQYCLMNTNGKRFKFSFVSQILVAHLQHLFFLKDKIRYSRMKWLRLYKAEGLALANHIRGLVGDEPTILQFKRIVSLKELKEWLLGNSYYDPDKYDSSVVSQIRIEVFRKLCILKCLDLPQNYASDFNVEARDPEAWKVFKTYLTEMLWEELGLPHITDTEIESTLTNKW